MRTEQRWNEIIFPRFIKTKFSKRLQHDLLTIKSLNEKQQVESVFIYGESGCGKTVRAAQLLVQEQKINYLQGNIDKMNCQFMFFPEYVDQLKQCFALKDDDMYYQLQDKYFTCSTIVIDEVGLNKPTEWFIDQFYLLINYRYENMLKTIITSNKSLKELSELYGDDRITSRIQRMCIIEKKEIWNAK